MNCWRLALIGFLCCLALPETVVQAAEQLEACLAGHYHHHQLPYPDQELPGPLEGDESASLVTDSDELEHGSFALLSQPKLLVEQVSWDASHGSGLSPRSLLNALHRFRI